MYQEQPSDVGNPTLEEENFEETEQRPEMPTEIESSMTPPPPPPALTMSVAATMPSSSPMTTRALGILVYYYFYFYLCIDLSIRGEVYAKFKVKYFKLNEIWQISLLF